MNAELLVILCGVFNLSFAIFHLFFGKIFDWMHDLKRLSFVNRAVMQVLNLCLAFVFVIFGYLLLFHASGMISTSLGHSLLILIGIFWFLRAIEQILFFGIEESISIFFFVLFVMGGSLHALPLLIL